MKNITKDNKGITIIALIITIILMLILVSVTTYTGINTYKNSQVTKFVAQMQLLQTKVDDLVESKTAEELNKMGLLNVTTQEQINAITNAFKKEEITTADTSKYKVFTKEQVLTILDVEDVQNDILVNFETREIISSIGIDYEGITYYTQYKLPGGQTIINNENAVSRELSFEILQTINGLNCIISIGNVSITNGTLKYAEIDSEGNINNWQPVVNYTEKDNTYLVNISKTGDYIFKLQDNTNSEKYFEKSISITLANKPKTSLEIDSYNYGEDSDKWAYAQKDSVNYVWIPRFVYSFNNEIKFIKGNSNISTDNIYIDYTWGVHSKFTTSDGIELTGIWVSVDDIQQEGLSMMELLNSDATTFIEI